MEVRKAATSSASAFLCVYTMALKLPPPTLFEASRYRARWFSRRRLGQFACTVGWLNQSIIQTITQSNNQSVNQSSKRPFLHSLILWFVNSCINESSSTFVLELKATATLPFSGSKPMQSCCPRAQSQRKTAVLGLKAKVPLYSHTQSQWEWPSTLWIDP